MPAAQSREVSWPFLFFSRAVKCQILGTEEGPLLLCLFLHCSHFFIQSLAQILHWHSGNVLVYQTMVALKHYTYSCFVSVNAASYVAHQLRLSDIVWKKEIVFKVFNIMPL